ncbi:putative transcriptional regulator [Rhizobium sp. SG_E_25_P2]|uniref:helix-turn-helix domain-containing protein n=1 Tax=Rhizobium sp. SG_E_25_P2 TaxID=2879942 RepID=UPI0024730597|nr:helix-turn-helix domain-containing protein [Rhizobium sp. SG_E_25_P2]MDH6268379.1 putative transcriptional regulator [Rhizobium sp. SG_E_25_P2]
MRNDERRRLREAILETAPDFHRGGIIDDETLAQITLRHLPEEEREIRIDIPSGPDIRAMREKARLSQAVFARRLNVSAGYVSQLERGVKTPSGPVLVLLDLIRRKGIEALS